MKKILLCVSVCTLALMAGCTKENVNGSAEPEGKGISFVGTISDPSSRVEVGAYEAGAQKVALYWNDTDEIVVTVYNKDGSLVEYNPMPNYPSYKMKAIVGYQATTETPAVTTGFETSTSNFTIPESVTEADIYSYYTATPAFASQGTDIKKLENPITREQGYNVLDGKAKNDMFLTAKADYTGQEMIELQFSNAFATMMVGVKGDAKIDSVKISNPAYALTFGNNVTVNVMNAPKPGTKDTKMLASYVGEETAFIDDMDGEMPIDGYMDAVLKLDRQLQLKSEVKWLPIMVMPLTGVNEMPLEFTIYATDKNGAASHITRSVTVPSSVDDITSNSIVYVSLKDINAVDLNQNAPKTDWQAGDVILEDDFSWIPTNWDSAQYDIYGWTDPYHGVFFPKYNAAPAQDILNQRGYIAPDYAIKMLYSYDGMLQLGVEYEGNGRLVMSLADLFTYTGNVALTFKAAPVYNKYGVIDGWSTDIPVTATDNGQELKTVTIDASGAEPFTWYEYTILIDNVTSDTQITFGANDQQYMFFIDDVKVAIANGETENTTGTKLDRPATVLQFSEPALTENAATIEMSPVKDMISTSNEDIATLPNIRFSVKGPWQLVVPEGNDWLKVHKVDWSEYDDPEKGAPRYNDAYGNEMTSIFYLQIMEDNDSGDARSVDLELKSGDVVLATYTINQPAAGQKTDIYTADFGDHTDPVTVSNTLTAEAWGIGTYSTEWLGITYDVDGNNPGLQLNNTAKSNYEGASGLGNLLFVGSVASTGGNEGGGGGDLDPWLPMVTAEGDPTAEFIVNIPQASIENTAYLYLNFGVWAKANWDIGEFEAQIIFNDATTALAPQTIQGWKFFENRIEVPEGTTSCTIKMHGVDKYGNSAAGAYRIDDVYVAVRAK